MAWKETNGTGGREEYFTMEDLPVLNLLENPIFVGDFKKGQKRWYFANTAGLRLMNKTLPQLVNMNMDTGQSQGADDYQAELWRKVQCGEQRVERFKTLYPAGGPVSTLTISKHIRFKPPNESTPRNCMLQELQVLDEKRLDTAIAAEMNLQSETIALSFDAQDQTLEHANQKARIFYELMPPKDGKATQQLQLRTLKDMFCYAVWKDETEREDLLDRIRSMALSSKRIQVELELAIPGMKDSIWHMFHFIPAPNPLNGRQMLIVNQHDVTMQRLQSEQLLATKAQEQFVSAVSHELRTPLNGIIGLSDSIMHSPDCTPRIAKMVEQVRSSGQRLAEMVDDIIDAASVRRGQVKLKYEKMDLKQVAALACEQLRASCQRSVELRCEISDAVPHIDADSLRIAQVLNKLVTNAIKFTAKGVILISARVLEDEEVVVEVSDTGVGIPRDKWERIWSPFTQLDMSSTRNHGGTGLGLSLVKKLVEAHGGRVGVKSQWGGEVTGSTFFFILPRRQPGRHSHLLSVEPEVGRTQSMAGSRAGEGVAALQEQVEALSRSLKEKTAELDHFQRKVALLEGELPRKAASEPDTVPAHPPLRDSPSAPAQVPDMGIKRLTGNANLNTPGPADHSSSVRSQSMAQTLSQHLLMYVELQEAELQQREALHMQQHAASSQLTRSLLSDIQTLSAGPRPPGSGRPSHPVGVTDGVGVEGLELGVGSGGVGVGSWGPSNAERQMIRGYDRR